MPSKERRLKEEAAAKEKEMTERQKAQQTTCTERYDEILKTVEEHRVTSADPGWKKGYLAIIKDKNKAYERIQKVSKKNASSVNHKSDLDELNQAVKEVKNSCDRLDERRSDMVRDVQLIQEFVKEWQLFKKQMPKTADFDFATGAVSIKPNK